MAASPVVLLNGARQTSKTTPARSLGAVTGVAHLTLDDIGFLSAARADPAGFLAGLSGPVVIDEVQCALALLPYMTLLRYLAPLETTFLVQTLPAWPLACCAWAGRGWRRRAPSLPGQLLGTFVAVEAHKLSGWSRTRPRPFHWRTQAQREVDLLLEDAAGRIAGVEVRASATASSSDFAGPRALAAVARHRFAGGGVAVLARPGNSVRRAPARRAAQRLLSRWPPNVTAGT